MVISRANFLIPGKKLHETKNWLVYQHPRPAYPLHLVLIPKKAYPDWMSIPAGDTEIFSEYLQLTQDLIRERNLEQIGYRLIVNGGEYQEFPIFHIHLVSGKPL